MITARQNDNLTLPAPLSFAMPSDDAAICDCFMRHLRGVPNSRMEIKILSAIQFTADMMNHSDAHVSKALVEMGLRAPRMAFPSDFLRYVDQALMRTGWDIGGPTPALRELKSYWNSIGEDRLAGIRGLASETPRMGAFV